MSLKATDGCDDASRYLQAESTTRRKMMRRWLASLLVIFLSVTCWVPAAAPGGIPMPFRIGGTVTLDGSPVTQATDDGLVVEVVKKNGSSYTDANGKQPQDQDGVSGSNWYLIDIPIHDAAEQPGGATPGEDAAIRVSLKGTVYSVVSPAGGLFKIGASGTNQQINVSAQSSPGPFITVVTPNGGESWQAGTAHTIQWTTTGDPGTTVKIELMKAGVLQSTVTAGTPAGTGGSGSFPWTVPAAQSPGTDYRIKVSSTSASSCSDSSDSDFAIVQGPADLPNLKPYKPNDFDDKLVISNKTGTHTDDTPLAPTDELFVDGGVINSGEAAVGGFHVKIYVDNVEKLSLNWPDGLQPGWFYYFYDYSLGSLSAGSHTIKMVVDPEHAITESNESDNVYSKTIVVGAPGKITVVSPNGGETWQTGSKQSIQWTYTGDPGPKVKVQLFKNNKLQKTMKTGVAVGSAGTGSTPWTVPATQQAGTDYKIKIVSTTLASCWDKSNGNFSIVSADDATPLESAKGVNGSVAEGAWQYYRIQAPASFDQIKVTLANLSADAELYVRKGAKPTGLTDSDGASLHLGTVPESITLANDGNTLWYIGVYGFAASTYTVTATLSDDKTIALIAGQAKTGSVALGDWKYYRITAPNGATQLTVNVTKIGEDVDLYLRKSLRPQQFDYAKASRKAGTTAEKLTATNSGENIWYIGVYGYKGGSFTVKATVSIPLLSE
jgi:hypothetical protein